MKNPKPPFELPGRALQALAAFCCLIIAPLYAVKVARKSDYMDFDVYYKAASRAAQGLWEHVYTLSDGASPFRYPPPALLFLRPLAELSRQNASLVWYGLQLLAFAVGFAFLRATLHAFGRDARLTQSSERHRLGVWVLSFVMILRLCLDAFTIGQVSSFMFAGFAGSFWAFVTGRPGLSGFFAFLPTFLKVGPGVLYGLLAAQPSARRRTQAMLPPVIAGLGLVIALWAWVGMQTLLELAHGWVQIVALDSTYYDASHYGSQSLKSALLRAAQAGYLPTLDAASRLHLGLSLSGVVGLFAFWLLRAPASRLGRASIYSLGIFAYLWFMPETFKYSLTPLAIPTLTLLASDHRGWLKRVALISGFLTIAFAGKDLVGDTLFFANQRASLPFFATLLLGAATLQQAWRLSLPSRWVRRLRQARATLTERGYQPWPEAPKPVIPAESPGISVIIPLPAPLGPLAWKRTAQDLKQFKALNAETLVIPWGPAWTKAGLQNLREMGFPPLLPTQLRWPSSRMEAILLGFWAARGTAVGTFNPEQPAHLDFYRQAQESLRDSAAVFGSRRAQEARFDVPTRVLPFVFGRHRLALTLQKVLHSLLGIGLEIGLKKGPKSAFTDALSGTALFNRPALIHALATALEPGLLGELELRLAIDRAGFSVKELPLQIRLEGEKSSHRVAMESLSIAFALPRIALRARRGAYDRLPSPQGVGVTRMVADDWGLSPGVNQGILELARLGILQGVSHMANEPHEEKGLQDLLQIPGLSHGIHFNLTHGNPLTAGAPEVARLRTGSPIPLLRASLARFTSPQKDAIRAEFEAQRQKLADLGVPLRGLDGHHHCHVFPGVLSALRPAIQGASHHASQELEIRFPYDPKLWFTSKAILNALAWFSMGRKAPRGRFFYPSPRAYQDPGLLHQMLARASDCEVICHPAKFDDLAAQVQPDTYRFGRVIEYRALRQLALRLQAQAEAPS